MASDIAGRFISFERVKTIALENVEAICRNITEHAYGTRSSHLAGLLAAAKSYIEDKPIRAKQACWLFSEKVREFIRGLDIRCIGELLDILPSGTDSRLPAWIYKGAVPFMGEDGWALVPSKR